MSGGQLNPNAWNNWYHVVGSTYGTWLPGDPRGFRTFRHKERVEGDYKKPPPQGMYTGRHTQSKRELKWPAVSLGERQRQVVLGAMVEKLRADEIELVAAAVGRHHFHLLARFPAMDDAACSRHRRSILCDGRDPSPRYFAGRARRHASFRLRELKLKPESPVWASRPKCAPVRNRPHQVNVAKYIERHVNERAAVWMLHCGFMNEMEL